MKTITEIEILKLARQRLDQKIDRAEATGNTKETEKLIDQWNEITARINEIQYGNSGKRSRVTIGG